jgi:HK97 family phage major capsid protein
MPNFLQFSVQDLGKERGKLIDAMKALNTAAQAESRDLSEEEDATFNSYAAQVEEIDGIIKSRQTSSTRTAKLDALTANQPKVNVGPSTAPRISDVREGFESDPKGGFKNQQEFFASVQQAGMTGKLNDDRLKFRQAAGSDEHSGVNDAYGGFTVPEGFMGGLMMVDPEIDPVAGLTTNLPVSTPTIHVNARVDKNHATSVTGGLRVYRREQTDEVSSSRMQTERITLTATSLMGVSYASEELLSDSPISFATLVANGFAQEIGASILNERINGTGVGQFEGVLTSPALVSVAKETGQKAASIQYENVVNMYARQYGKNRAIWVANHNTLPALMQMNQSVGTAGIPAWQPSAREGAPNLLLGRPIYFTEFCPTLGTVGDLLFVDWSQYLEITLGGINTAESVHVRFLNNERAFRVSVRNDGKGWWRSALTPKNGSTLSPFVALATRA